jgi:MPBQ/MSBQ methyltransferase
VAERSLFKLQIAQEAYSQRLLNFIPPEVKTVLDVGCGIGGNAVFLLKQGLKVDGLAPDSFQKKKFLEATEGKAIFHDMKFEDFTETAVYDLVLLSESSQYMASEDIARGAARVLKPGGYLLLADMLRSDANYSEGIFSNCHVVEGLNKSLSQSGFTLIKQEDISQQIAPTLDLAIEHFRQFGLSTGEYIGTLIKIAVPPLYALLNWAYKRWLQKAIAEGLAARKIFDKHLCYEIQLWQLSEENK